MAELPDIEEFIIQTLKSVITGGRVFSGTAPEGTAEPYVIVQNQSEGNDEYALGANYILTDPLYIVKVVARTRSWKLLLPFARIIRSTLHNVSSELEDGRVLSCLRVGPFSLIEQDGEDQYRHYGGRYRLQMQ